MENQFIPYEQALELKELGFNEGCIASYTQTLRYDVLEQNGIMWHTVTNEKLKEYEKACTAPLYQQAFRWFREKHQLFSWVKVEYEYGGYSCGIYITGVRQSDIANGPYSTYEEAELACLKKLIEIIKNK